jgi:hypothetical protein
MRDLNSSLPLTQLGAALNLPQNVIDALIESGRVLCRLQGGELLVPLSEIESVLRDTLIRVYAAEARAHAGLRLAADAIDPLPSSDARRAAAREPYESAPVIPPLEAPAAATQTPAADAAPPADSEPAMPRTAAQAQSEAARSLEFARSLDHDDDDRPDLRRATRYVPLRQISGIFAEAKFTVLQLSATGLRIRHTEPLLPGDEAKLTFALLRTARSVVVRARVVWTSVARIGDEQFSISGIRVLEHADRLEKAIEAMKAAHELQPERRASLRRAEDAVTMLREVSDEEMALVTSALHKFAADPVEASRWYSRGRFALADENVRRIAPQRGREEVLGVWEYLERQVDLEKVAGVMRWVRG